jgi:hypothetical protein
MSGFTPLQQAYQLAREHGLVIAPVQDLDQKRLRERGERALVQRWIVYRNRVKCGKRGSERAVLGLVRSVLGLKGRR